MKEGLDSFKELRDLLETQVKPTPVEIVGTTFGNKLQNRISIKLSILNYLMFYLCAFSTFRYLIAGN